ncbi:MAG: hypothetical protein K2O42_09085, partial [Oscillospiraceae bacterium]|nr:hypothetical protein [Oscillospiraceae bacterium]
MEKYDLIKKYKIPDVYNLLFLENELNKMQSNKYELKKIDDKDVFYFKKQMQSKNIRYFILITHFEHKVLLDRSEQKMVIENQTISNYLIENDVKYNLFFKDKKSFYVYKLINIDIDMLDSIKKYRYQ